jgi:hypothetical protein
MMLYNDYGHQYLWPCAYYESAWGRGGTALLILKLNGSELPASHPGNVVPNAENPSWAPKPDWTLWRK